MSKQASDIEISEYLKCLVYGSWGTGKTWFIGTAPKPLYVLDVDSGMQTLEGLPQTEYDDYSPNDDPKDLKPLVDLTTKVNELVDDCPYETVALDSATVLAQLVKNRIITLNNRWNADNKMRIQDWGVLADELTEIFSGLQSIDANVIITGHNRVVLNEDTNAKLYLPLSEAGQSFPQKAPLHFDEVYRMVVRKKPGNNQNDYMVQTESDQQWSCKSRLNYYDPDKNKLVRVFDKYEDADFSKMLEKVKKARKRVRA